jgi:hypothetical protein
MPLAEVNTALDLMKRGEQIRGVVTFQEALQDTELVPRMQCSAPPLRRDALPSRGPMAVWVPALRSGASAPHRVRDTRKGAAPYQFSGQGSTIRQRSVPFLIFFISVVRPPFRRIQSFTESG